jgi:UDP-glucuronate decarboxylase
VTTAARSNGKQHASEAGARKRRSTDRPILVCGGAGFLGSHLCARLLREGKRVICLDNFCTSDEDAIEHLVGEPGFEVLRADVAELDDETFEPVSAIYNLACAASPIHYQRSPLDTLFSSVHGMDHLLRLARRYQVRIFQASTSEIYGHPTVHPQTESYWGHVNTMGPRACYDEGKRCAETLCYIYHDQYDVPVRVGRIFNTYGPGMRVSDGRVVINFIVQALAGEPLTVYGDGSQTRSFCYVDDLIDAITRIMDERNAFVGPINIGNPAEITVLELAQRILRLTGSRSKMLVLPLPKDDPPRRRPDISVAAKLLDWHPQTDLDTGLMRTLEDVERRLEAEDEELISAIGRGRAALANRRVGITGTAL